MAEIVQLMLLGLMACVVVVSVAMALISEMRGIKFDAVVWYTAAAMSVATIIGVVG